MEKMISKKRTLLISTLYDSGQVAEPVACGYLAAYLIKHKHPTDILCTFPDDKNIKIIISKISDYKPSLIAFTAWDINVEFVLLVSKIIKQRYKNITIIVGGYQAPKLSLLHNDSIDHLVIGEGENAILSIISSLENNRVIKDRIIKSQPIKNLDNLPFPARQLIDYDLFPLIDELRTSNNISLAYSYIFTYRGCPMSCTFCAIHQVHEKNIRKRSIPNIMEELGELYEKHHINTFINEEDMLFIDKKRVIEWCNALVRSQYKYVWTCSGTVRYMDEEILFALKEAGCKYVFLGSISGSDKILKEAKAGFKVKHLQAAIEIADKVGMPISSSFMIGFPNETNETLNETSEFIKYNRSLYWDMGVGIVKSYTGTHLIGIKDGKQLSYKQLMDFIRAHEYLIDFSF